MSMSLEEVEAIDPTTDDHSVIRRLRHTAQAAIGPLGQHVRCSSGHSTGPGQWHEKLSHWLDKFDSEAALARAAVAKAVAILEAHGAGSETPVVPADATAGLEAKAQKLVDYGKAHGWQASSTASDGTSYVSLSHEDGRLIQGSWTDGKFDSPGSFTRASGESILLRNASDARKVIDGALV